MISIRLLVEEHDNILRMLDVIRAASLSILDGGTVEVDDWRKMVDFIRGYADKTHHGKEEQFLFKAMTDELGPVAENLVRHGMLVEHDIARLYVADLVEGLDVCAARPTAQARLNVLVAAGSYERMLRRHITKENDAIFPYGQKHLSPGAAQRVEAAVEAFEAANTRERERHLAVLHELEGKYCR